MENFLLQKYADSLFGNAKFASIDADADAHRYWSYGFKTSTLRCSIDLSYTEKHWATIIDFKFETVYPKPGQYDGHFVVINNYK